MSIKDKIATKIEKDWGATAPQYHICMLILDYVYKGIDKYTHITLQGIREIINAERKFPDHLTVSAIQYLCGERVQVLAAKFEYIDDNDNIHPLSDEDLREIKKTDSFAHPDTGEAIANYKENIFIYFVPGKAFQEITAL